MLYLNLNGTHFDLSWDVLNSEESINYWKDVLKRQSNQNEYNRFLAIVKNAKKSKRLQKLLATYRSFSGNQEARETQISIK